MSRLTDLRKSLLDMSPDELREKIKFSREDRRLVKVTEKAPAQRRVRNADKATKLFQSLPPELQAALLKDMLAKEGKR